MAISTVLQSIKVSLHISKQTANIKATAATFTAFKKALITFDFRIRGIIGLSTNTNKNEGKKIPNVAAKPPDSPFICQPINVAVDNTGPGVNCPTATASISSCLDSQPFATSSVSRKANNT